MSKLEIRLLGGFQVLWDGLPIDSFESQKVRALFSYLACWTHRAFSRDQLADLLWPHQNPDAARRNLRQALYNLRRAIVLKAGEEHDPLITTQQSVRFKAEPWIWLDVEAFQEILPRNQLPDGAFDPKALARAVQLYKGDFLAGFFVKDCIDFEAWMLQEQEQLREASVGVLRTLVEHHLNEGRFAQGIRYSRLLLKIDPLSEDAHRRLMRLYAFSGRRGRAISVYRELRGLLAAELGIEPLEETTAEYEAIVAEAMPGPRVAEKAGLGGPIVPIVGREGTLVRLRKIWSRVQKGKGHITLVQGEAGVGKTRLLRSFFDEASRTGCLLLRGRCHDTEFPPCLGPLAEALSNALAHEADLAEHLLPELAEAEVMALSLLLPDFLELEPAWGDLPPANGLPLEAIVSSLLKCLRVLSRLSRDGEEPKPIILFLDDLHWGDDSSRAVLQSLGTQLEEIAVWLVITLQPDHEGSQKILDAAQSWRREDWEPISLRRLREEDVIVIAKALAIPSQAQRLAHELLPCEGLPLAVCEKINLIWSREGLVEGSGGKLFFPSVEGESDSDKASEAPPSTLEEDVLTRIAELPTSTRRLVSLASVAGYDFDMELLQLAEKEHPLVVETGLKVLVEHWIIRHVLGYWADSRRQRDLALGASGPGNTAFEFTHSKIRRAIYQSLDPARRKVLHRQTAQVLEKKVSGGEEEARVALAQHYYRAGAWRKALGHLRRASEMARRIGAEETALQYQEKAQECSRRLQEIESTSGSPPWHENGPDLSPTPHETGEIPIVTVC